MYVEQNQTNSTDYLLLVAWYNSLPEKEEKPVKPVKAVLNFNAFSEDQISQLALDLTAGKVFKHYPMPNYKTILEVTDFENKIVNMEESKEKMDECLLKIISDTINKERYSKLSRGEKYQLIHHFECDSIPLDNSAAFA